MLMGFMARTLRSHLKEKKVGAWGTGIGRQFEVEAVVKMKVGFVKRKVRQDSRGL